MRTFKRANNGNFAEFKDASLQSARNKTNLAFDRLGQILAFSVVLVTGEEANRSPIEHIQVVKGDREMEIRIPKALLFEELLSEPDPFERLMLSKNARLLVSGKILIQLNADMDDINDIGCIVMKQRSDQNLYHFHSLLDDDDVRIVAQTVRSSKN